jgi:D-alanine-D-alanine ligase
VKKFGKVGVLMGGLSAEREISLMSGQGVLNALLAQGVDAYGVDVGADIVAVLEKANFDRVFNVLHGPVGEDGTIQGVLEILGIPYTGSGVLGSAIAMDKARTKYIWAGIGLPTPSFVVLDLAQDWISQVAHLTLPFAVKPVIEGSSIGINCVDTLSDLVQAVEEARPYGQVMVENWIKGSEYTVGIVEGQQLPSVRIEVADGFYDYQQKYFVDTTQYTCPSELSDSDEANIQHLARRAFDSLGCQGWGRVDLMRDTGGAFHLLEVNTNTGMASTSLVPKAAKVIGWSYEDLVIAILKQTL